MAGLGEAELAWLVEELSALVGGLLQDVRQPDGRTLVLTLRLAGATRHLLVHAGPLGRLHAVRLPPPNPRSPLPFQNLARARLRGRLIELVQVPGERIVHLAFGPSGGPPEHRVVAELTGPSSDLFLVDSGGVVLGTLGNRGGGGGRPRAGEVYFPPPPPPRGPPAGAVRFVAATGGDLPRSQAVETWFEEREAAAREADLRARVERALRSASRRLARKEERQEVEAARGAEAEEWRRRGDLLVTAMGSIRRGMKAVSVTDWTLDEPTAAVVPLAPELDARGNVDRCFRMARRMRDGATRAAEELGRTRAETALVAGMRARADEARGPEELQAIWEALPPAWRRGGTGPGPRPRGKSAPRQPYHAYRAPGGERVLAGRSASDNDALTFGIARGKDLWLHARGRAGAHVVVPTRGRQPSGEAVRLAAQLALKLARLPEGERWEVATTEVRHVRKVGGAPGKVTYTQERVVVSAWRAEDLARLVPEEE